MQHIVASVFLYTIAAESVLCVLLMFREVIFKE